jgi:uncharacterized protein YbjT (DUF2867 family)
MKLLVLGDIFADKLAGERVVRESGLDWTFLYPTLRADVADFALRILGERDWFGKVAALSD